MHPILIAPLTIARIWKQPNCLSTDECIKISDTHTYTHTHTHISHTYTVEHYLVIKRMKFFDLKQCGWN